MLNLYRCQIFPATQNQIARRELPPSGAQKAKVPKLPLPSAEGGKKENGMNKCVPTGMVDQ